MVFGIIFGLIFLALGIASFVDLGLSGFRVSRLLGGIGFTLMGLGCGLLAAFGGLDEEIVGLAVAGGVALGVGFIVTIIAIPVAQGERRPSRRS